jgi:hypothetical protein
LAKINKKWENDFSNRKTMKPLKVSSKKTVTFNNKLSNNLNEINKKKILLDKQRTQLNKQIKEETKNPNLLLKKKETTSKRLTYYELKSWELKFKI